MQGDIDGGTQYRILHRTLLFYVSIALVYRQVQLYRGVVQSALRHLHAGGSPGVER